MRLTPSWLRSSSEDVAQSDEPDTASGVTIYHTPSSEFADDDSGSDHHVGEFVPESDTELVAVLEEMNTPVTVDEVADRLIRPARPSVETWAGVHERLYEHRLPELDAAGDIVFDESQGLVERPRPARAGDQGGVAVAAAASKTSVSPLVVFLALLSLVLLSGALVVAMSFAV